MFSYHILFKVGLLLLLIFTVFILIRDYSSSPILFSSFTLSQKFKHQELSSDDYFSKNNEFAAWLKEEKHLFFSDLSSESARDLFSVFVVRWNDSELEPCYYEGIAACPRTSYKCHITK